MSAAKSIVSLRLDLLSKCEDLSKPVSIRFHQIWPMDGLEAALTFFDVSIQIRDTPVNSA